MLRLLAFRVEPDADFGAAGDLFADRVDVLSHEIFRRAGAVCPFAAIQVVALADRPLHQLRTAVDEVVGAAAVGAVRGAGADGIRIVVQHKIRNRVVNDLARLAGWSGRISTIFTQRGSVSGMSDIGRNQTSWCSPPWCNRLFHDQVGGPKPSRCARQPLSSSPARAAACPSDRPAARRRPPS